jgi:sortase (surface protein transpeptidase)
MRRAAYAATLTAPTPLPTATPTPYFIKDGDIVRRSDAPITLRIPKIGVNAPVESVGLDPSGAMATPTTPFRVAWFDGGPLPGQPGNAVIDGHLDSRIYGMAVFWNLGKLVPGDTVEVEMPGQRWLTFVVERVAVYPYDAAPLDQIFGPSDVPHLNLITCSGVFDRSSHNYDRRRVVYTRLDDR